MRNSAVDPGGSGYEIVKEATACPECAAAHQAPPQILPPSRGKHAQARLIRCEQLREIGIIQDRYRCCPRCHTDAGLVGYDIRDRYRAAYCCARMEPLTPSETEAIAARIPEWEARGVLSSRRHGERLLGFGGIVRVARDGRVIPLIGGLPR